MGTSIERIQPKLPKKRNGTRPLSVYDRPGSVAPHLDLAKRILMMEQRANSPELSVSLRTWFRHESSAVGHASRGRAYWLPWFQAAAAAAGALFQMHGSPALLAGCPVQRPQATDMLGALLRTFGCKDDDVILGMVDMLESAGELAAADGKRPLYVSPVSLALACRTLIATKTFRPQPAELREACREADYKLACAHGRCNDLEEYVRRWDAILLEFDPEQWRAPYLTPQYQPVVQHILFLHEIYGNGDDDFSAGEPEDWDEDFVEKPRNRSFRLALKRARQEFPKPEPEKLTEEAKPKIAACKAPTAKRTHKA